MERGEWGRLGCGRVEALPGQSLDAQDATSTEFRCGVSAPFRWARVRAVAGEFDLRRER